MKFFLFATVVLHLVASKPLTVSKIRTSTRQKRDLIGYNRMQNNVFNFVWAKTFTPVTPRSRKNRSKSRNRFKRFKKYHS